MPVRLVAAFLIGFVVFGCAEESTTEPGPRSQTQSEEVHGPRSADASLADVARDQVRGFAGTMIQEDGSHVVFITADGDRAAARAYLTSLRSEIGRDPIEPTFVVVQFDFAQLYDWFNALGNAGAFVGASRRIDEVNNRIEIAGPASSLSVARGAMAALGIPMTALELIEGAARIRNESHTLGDPADTTRAGFRASTSTGYCTMSPWGILSSGAYAFIASSHCSATPYSQADGGTFRQPTGTTRAIGYEYVDLPFQNCTFFEKCRYSDAAYVLGTGSIPRGRGLAKVIPATTYINHTKPWNHYSQMRASEHLVVGDSVYMTGSFNGRRGGTIQENCFHAPAEGLDSNGYSGTLRCQVVASYYSAGGDSGAPLTHGGHYAGVHVGEVTLGNQSYKAFSPIESVVEELGTINVCSRPPIDGTCEGWL